MTPIEVAISIEEEKKKCLNQLKKYYSKYGNPDLQKLYDYLTKEYNLTTDDVIKQELSHDLDIISEYIK
jgi:hypothetical protein